MLAGCRLNMEAKVKVHVAWLLSYNLVIKYQIIDLIPTFQSNAVPLSCPS